jgi:autotransporter-associated beta strand protein
VTQININPLAALSTGSQYTLINGYTGTIAGANFTAGSITGDATHSIALQNTAGSVTAIIGAATPTVAYWSGASDGNWTTMAPTTAATNWRTTATDNIDTQALPGSVTDVYFATTNPAAANLSPALNQAVTIKSLTFDNSISATAGITVPGALTVSNAAGITNNNAAGGAVTISAPVALGVAQTWTNNNTTDTLTVSGAVTNGANGLTIAGAGNTTISGVVGNGAGTLTKSGSGTLALGANNTYTGNTILDGGTVQYTADNVYTVPSVLTLADTSTITAATLSVGPSALGSVVTVHTPESNEGAG